MIRTIHLHVIPAAVVSLLLLTAPGWLSASPVPLVVNFDVNYAGNGIQAPAGPGPGTYSGYAAGPVTAGTYWNAADGGYAGLSVNPVTSNGSVLLADGSTPTNVAFSVDSTYGYYGSATSNALLDDFATVGGGAPGNFSLTNVPAGTYDVYVYAINGSFGGGSTGITLSSGTPDGGISTTVYPNGDNTGSYVEGVNYVLFKGVTPTSGTISGTYAGANGHGEGDFAGIQLVQAPEPSTLMLTGLAGLGLVARVPRRGALR